MVNGSNKIIWIASYPKSGNTLLRTIISSLVYSENGELKDFNVLKNIPVFENFEYLKNIYSEKKLKSFSNIEFFSKFWDKTQKEILKEKNTDIFFKTHHARVNFDKNSFPSKLYTKGFIYIVRDPRDIVISYAKHLGVSIDEILYRITKINAGFRYSNQNAFKKKFNIFGIQSSWKHNILSWLSFDVPSLIIKYEDLIHKKEEIIYIIYKLLTKDMNLQISNFDNKLKNILLSTSFEHMKNLEDNLGFNDIVVRDNFFNYGISGRWQIVLTKKQKEFLENSFYSEMKQFNYL